MKKRRNSLFNKGFTVVEILIVIAIISTLATMSLPQFTKARASTKKGVCLNNLRQIDAAIDRWVFENDFPEGGTLSSSQEAEVYSFLKSGKPECPSGGVYSIGTIGVHPQVSCTITDHVLLGAN